MNSSNTSPSLRQAVYALVVVLAAGSAAGRIVAVTRVYEPALYRPENSPDDARGLWPRARPEPAVTHGDNDRSRWDTVRALVDEGTYVIGHRDRAPLVPSAVSALASSSPLELAVCLQAGYTVRTTSSDHGIVTEDGWRTIDKVLRPDSYDFYSSKPPLLSTLVAGEYWLQKNMLGWSITADRWYVVRAILLTINGIPLVIYLHLLSRLLERFGRTDWGRIYVLGAAGFGTLLTAFATTFNNHSIATCCALFALYPALQIWCGDARRPGLFVAAGFFAGLTVATELPAAAFALALLALLLYREPGRTLLWFVPAAAIPAAAFLGTNYLAIGQLRPAYDEFGGPWYEFEGSYWKLEPGATRHGIDWAYQTETRAGYAFNVLFGHHGLFSLTPIYLLATAGMVYGICRWRGRAHNLPPKARQDQTPGAALQMIAVLTFLLTVVVLAFYLFYVSDRSRNYGGWTSGLRWLMWLTPFWLLTMVPVADWLATRRWGRGLGYLLLAVSVFSATYPVYTPWRHPWLYSFLEDQGWIRY